MVIIAGFLGIGFVKEYAENSDQDDQEIMGKVKPIITGEDWTNI